MALFPTDDWYYDAQAARDAISNAGEFNAIHGASGAKIDFWVRARRPYEAVRFSRRRRGLIAGVECWLLSPEDTILAKLEWTKNAPSDRQAHDIAGIFAVQAGALDLDYLAEWAERLGVAAALAQFTSSG